MDAVLPRRCVHAPAQLALVALWLCASFLVPSPTASEVVPWSAIASRRSPPPPPPCGSDVELVTFLQRASNASARDLQALLPNAEPTHKVWRLNVPGSASSNLKNAVERGVAQDWPQRLLRRWADHDGRDYVMHDGAGTASDDHGDAEAPAGCEDGSSSSSSSSRGGRLAVVGCSKETFRTAASFLSTGRQSQHADYSHLARLFLPTHFRDTFVHKEPEPGQRILTMTMVRDPFDHFVRSYEKKSRPAGGTEKTFMFAPTWRLRNVSTTKDNDVPLSEFAAKAFWRWNIFSRTLAGNFSGGHILNGRLANDDITAEMAKSFNADARAGRSDVLDVAKQRLRDMTFFGLFERLEESMRLLAHTFCWDFESLGFSLRNRKHKAQFKNLQVKPTGEPEDAELTEALIESNNYVDRQLYIFATELFEKRVQQMHTDQASGVVCRFADTDCVVQWILESEPSESDARDRTELR